MRSFLRVVKFAFQDMSRNFGLSFMTVLILVLMLLSINTLVIIRVLTAEATTSIKDQIDMSIFLSEKANQKSVDDVRTILNSMPEVKQVDYYTPDQVMEQFRERRKNRPEVLASLSELSENPFGATLVVQTNDPGDYKKIITLLEEAPYKDIVEDKTFGDTERAIDRVETITKQVEKFSLALSTLFAVIAFLIIFNTIRVAIYTQRMEIGIKRLVGATNWFIRGPYFLEAIFFSILSAIIAYGLVYVAVNFLDPYVTVVFNKDSFLTSYFTSNILFLFLAQFAAVLFLTAATSALAMRKYLRV